MTNNWTPEPWRYHKPFIHKFYMKRDPQGTWLLDMKDYGRAMKCVNLCAGLNEDEIAEAVRAFKYLKGIQS